MDRINVSRDLFDRFAEWALARGDDQLFLGASCWGDAPSSEERQGRKALEYGSNRYNQVSRMALERFLEERPTRTVEIVSYSDRTGPYTSLWVGPS